MDKYKLVCIDCGAEYRHDEVEYMCPKCEGTGDPNHAPLGVLKCEYDCSAAKQNFKPDNSKYKDHKRYISILPLVSENSLPELPIGPTPLNEVSRLRKELGLNNLFIKNDTGLPTGSYKDRASSVVVAKAIELKKDIITAASTGNAATALAGMCASVGMKNVIFVPAAAPQAKLTQIATFGAKLILVKGTYDDAFALSIEATKEFGWYNRNTAYNPYTVEGKKTAALEIWEQLGCKAPDKVLVPTGDGVIIAGVYKGFYDLKQLGLIDRIPQMIPVQSENSAAIVDAVESNADYVTALKSANTVADSISVLKPSNGSWALKLVKETNGFGIKVTDDEIIKTIHYLAKLTGIFAEPAAATAVAGLIKATRENKIGRDEIVVVIITGTGLKDVPAAQKAVSIPEAIEPKLEIVKGLM